MDGALPNLVVIGAHKAGTTALHYYLSEHPEIGMSIPKELDFFIAAADPGGPDGRSRVHPNWERGLDWYRTRFDVPEFSRIARGRSKPWEGCSRLPW